MIIFTQKVLRKEPGGWTFVLVTDRRELDKQLHGECSATGVVGSIEVQATSSTHLRELLADAKHLLETIADRLVLDWRKTQRARSAVRVAVGQVLDELPDAYDDDLFEAKHAAVFDHVLASFFDDGGSVYETVT